ncbi:hypothetical protein KEJ23_04405, partial [Candidatus Bathyarchaeota archaeon]|nr:hypothetical protein [Candidatus Bathyarchaeota archaeon]
TLTSFFTGTTGAVREAYQPSWYPEEYWGPSMISAMPTYEQMPTYMFAPPTPPEIYTMFAYTPAEKTLLEEPPPRMRGGGGGGGFYEAARPALTTINPFIEVNFQDVSIDPGTYARFKRELAYTISRAICDAV